MSRESEVTLGLVLSLGLFLGYLSFAIGAHLLLVEGNPWGWWLFAVGAYLISTSTRSLVTSLDNADRKR